MRLDALIPEATDGPHAALQIGGLAADSRKAKQGSLFFAVPGTQADGLDFAPQAIANGAVAIVAAQPMPTTEASSVSARARCSDAVASATAASGEANSPGVVPA